MSLLNRLREFLDNIQRIREALERLSPRDPRREPHNLYRDRK